MHAAGVAVAGLSIAVCLGGLPGAVYAGDPPRDLDPANVAELLQMSLEDLLEVKVSVATPNTQRSVRNSPAVVTVLQREELLRTGARELVDALMLVPGIQFGTDTYDTIFASFRGMWGAEGKVLFLVDGHEMQDLMYMMTPLGNRISMDWIERIEIIRGPGSVVYGGSAELGVINIVTRHAEGLEGVAMSGSYSQTVHDSFPDQPAWQHAYGRRNLSLSAGHRTTVGGDELHVGVGAFVGQGNRSDRTYTDQFGTSVDMAGNSELKPFMVSAQAEWKGLKLAYLFEHYRTTQIDGYDAILPTALSANFLTSSARLSYAWKPTDELTLTPQVRFLYQRPWQTTDEAAEGEDSLYYEPVASRLTAGMTAGWDASETINLLAGVEYASDYARDEIGQFKDAEDPELWHNTVRYQNLAGYLQTLVDTRYINLSLGARYEHHSQFGSSFVPRASASHDFGPFNLKLLASQAFHAPSIANLAMTPDVRPERTTIFEAEASTRVLENLFASLNVFDMRIDNPIIYYFDSSIDQEGYENGDETGTRGVELSAQWREKGRFVSLGYSYYLATSRAEPFAVPDDEQVMLGFAPHKATLSAGVGIGALTDVSARAVLLGNRRFAYASNDEAGDPVLRDMGSELLLDLVVTRRDVVASGVTLSLGLYNLLDTRQVYIQPYNNGHAPLPGNSRELLLKVGYELSANVSDRES